MSDNAAPPNDDTVGSKFARWIAWILIATCCVFFFVYAALFH